MCFALLGGFADSLGCARPAASSDPLGAARASVGSIALSQTLILTTSGAPPHDTTITFRAGEPRTILLLHPPPDNTAFAELTFEPSTFAADSGRDVTVRLRARPGIYGLDVETSSPIGKGAVVTFKYARYFSAPPEARRLYSSDVAFERALVVARLQPDSMLVFLPSTRPVADNLQAPLPAAGTYLVAAPRAALP